VRDHLLSCLAKFFLFLSGLFRSSKFSGLFYRFEIILGTLLHRPIIFYVPVFPLLRGPRYVLLREFALLDLLTEQVVVGSNPIARSNIFNCLCLFIVLPLLLGSGSRHGWV
jgi:hypothetical protein